MYINVLRIVNSEIRLTGLEICFGGGFSPFGWPRCVYALCLSTWGQNVSCTCSNEVSVRHFYSEGNSQQGSDGFFLISIITSAVPHWTNVPPGQDVSDIHMSMWLSNLCGFVTKALETFATTNTFICAFNKYFRTWIWFKYHNLLQKLSFFSSVSAAML